MIKGSRYVTCSANNKAAYDGGALIIMLVSNIQSLCFNKVC